MMPICISEPYLLVEALGRTYYAYKIYYPALNCMKCQLLRYKPFIFICIFLKIKGILVGKWYGNSLNKTTDYRV